MRDAWDQVFTGLYLTIKTDVLNLTSWILGICIDILGWIVSKIPDTPEGP